MPEFEIATLIAFVSASVALNLTPGADVLFITTSGAAGGRKAGVAAAMGVSLGSLFHTVLAVAGVAALIEASPAAFTALRWVGAGYLLYLAWKAWTAPPPAFEGQGARSAWSAFRRGALTNILNPKVSIFVLSFLPQFTDPSLGPVWIQIAVLGCLFSFGSIPVNCAWGLGAGFFGDRLRRFGRVMNRVSALVFGGLAARLAIN